MNEEQKLTTFESEETTHYLSKFKKTNQNTCINLVPIVQKGDKVQKGQFLTSGYAIDKGELALAMSEAVGTPGTLADKAAVLNKFLLISATSIIS